MNKSGIRVLSYDRNGKITFGVKGKRYTYLMDAMYFYNGFFKSWIKYAPGKALNFAKQVGDREDLPPKPTPEKKQGFLFH